MSNSQLNKSGIKNGTEETLKLLSNVAGVSNVENSFMHKFLLTNKYVLRFIKIFIYGSSANIKLSKTTFSKIVQLGGFLGRRLGPLLKTELPFS